MKNDILEQTAREYFSSGLDEYAKERYNSAVVLFFKAIVAYIDLLLLQKTNHTPSSHNDRFRMAQKELPDIYDILDKDFPFYQDSYIQKLSKELAEVMKNDAQIVAKKAGIEL
ncbi:MAG: hypothetical protein AABW65_01320 [Nanoarchaeota archaeon]